jgi:hypothetical protein
LHDRPEGHWHGFEKLSRPLGKISVIEPARRHQSEIKMFLAHFLGRLGRCPLLRREPGIEIETVFFLDVKADERRIGNNHAAVIDIRQLAFWRLAIPAAIFAILRPANFNRSMALTTKGLPSGSPK